MLSVPHALIMELTDTTDRQYACQRRYLERNKWKFEVSRAGRPVVALSYYEWRMGVSAAQEPAAEQKPDFSNFRKVA